MRSLSYLINSAKRIRSEKKCPYCGSNDSVTIDRKYIVTKLLACNNCSLYFRHPKDSVEFNKVFYQKSYKESDITRNIPDNAELEILKQERFINSGKDYSDKIRLFSILLENQKSISKKVVDYGASWGYGSFQFKSAGFEVQSYEISKPMAEAGKKLLSVDIKSNVDDLRGDNDIFFNGHVIEHLPDIKELFSISKKLLKHNGFFISYCPNGSDDFRYKNPKKFHRWWGLVHPNYLNNIFFQKAFAQNPYLITSSSSFIWQNVREWDQQSQIVNSLSGEELIVIAKINESF